jgi:hypothetical protein
MTCFLLSVFPGKQDKLKNKIAVAIFPLPKKKKLARPGIPLKSYQHISLRHLQVTSMGSRLSFLGRDDIS